MNFINFFSYLFVFFVSFCSANEIDYSQFNSPKEAISFETEKIASIPDSEPAMLSSAYMDRAETLIIAEDAETAIDDLKNGLYYASFCPKKSEKDLLICRGLFDLCIAYGALDRIEELKSTGEEFLFVLSNLQCNDCHHGKDCSQESYGSVLFAKNASRNNQRGHIMHCRSSKDWPILGPDRIPIRDCIERVGTTAHALKVLVAALIKRQELQPIFNSLIDSLATEAEKCCYAGGLWKGCLKPLTNRLHNWKALGIPADPYWD